VAINGIPRRPHAQRSLVQFRVIGPDHSSSTSDPVSTVMRPHSSDKRPER
jgi:hypothetical protein